jgi:DNA-binding NarL/FixJ family response regulator
MKTDIAIYIVSPCPVVAEGFWSILKVYVGNINSYFSPGEFFNYLESNNCFPYLVILDAMVGTAIVEMMTEELRKKFPDSKLLVIASETDTFSSKMFLSTGIAGIINRNAPQKEILHAVSRILGNGQYFSPILQYKMLQAIVNREKYLGHLRNDFGLSEKDLKVIRLIGLQKTSKEIAVLLSTSQRTVEGVRARILRKLNVANGIGLVLFGLKHNLFTIDDINNVPDADLPQHI